MSSRYYEYVFALKDKITKVMGRIGGHQDKLMRKFDKSRQTGVRAYEQIGRAAKGYENILHRIKRVAVTAIGAGVIIAGARDLTAVTAKFQAFEDTINFTSGSALEAKKNQDFLRVTIDRYKLPLEATTQGFSRLAGSMLGTKLQGAATRKIFDGVSVAAAGLKLTSDQVNGAFLALGQIMSKGKVQAEELRGQLGERIPGAFNIAARAMGVTQSQLNKLLETGKVTAEDFLPKFADELKRTFAGALPAAVNSLQANINAFETDVTRMKVQLGTELRPAMTAFFQTMSEGLRELNPLLIKGGHGLNAYLMNAKDNLLGTLKGGVKFIQWLADHRKQIVLLTKVYVAYKVALVAYNLTLKASSMLLVAYNGILRLTGTMSVIAATGIRTARDAMAAFNLVTGMSPLGAIAALLATAATAFLLFRNKLKDSNDEFSRFNKLNEDFKNGQASIADSKRLFDNLDKLNPRQAQNLLQQLKGQKDEIEDQLLASNLFLKSKNLDELRKELSAANSDPSREGTALFISKLNEIKDYKEAQDQSKRLSKSFDQLTNQIAVVSGLVNAANGQHDSSVNLNSLGADAGTQSSIDGVISGGRRTTHVNLTIDKLYGIGEVVSDTVEENLQEVGDQVLDRLTRVINGALQGVR